LKFLGDERIGEVNKNTWGSEMIIVGYRDSLNITVKFSDSGFITKSEYQNFKKGEISSPYDKSMCKIGYLGEGKYKRVKNRKPTIQYEVWSDMFKRCYGTNRKKYSSYVNCTIDEEWHCFQNFAKWFDDNYYAFDEQRLCLDKDIILKRNKHYSPDTCVFVPKSINSLFVKCDASRGEYPESSNVSHRERCASADILKNSITAEWDAYTGDLKDIVFVAKIV
jgi:hypothetical protein